MNEAVLLYNYKGERLKAVRNVLLSMKIPVKIAVKKDFSKPVGTLFGLKDIEPLSDDFPTFDGELMVIKDFPYLTLNVMLRKLEEKGIRKMPLMCALTPDNSRWSGNRLYKTVSEEHRQDRQNTELKVNLN